jgi:ABC-2 type transport system permease protein
MSPEVEAMADTVATPGAATASPPIPRPFLWSLRRELWENRSLYLAPLGVAGLFLIGFFIGLVQLPAKMRSSLALPPDKLHEALVQPYDFAALAIMATMFIIAVLYCLDALYGERRDRSILFWKSLPVSDRTAVLAKATIAAVFTPLVSFVVTVATQLVMLLLSTMVLAGSGLSPARLWQEVALVPMSLMVLYHLITIHMLWYAPIYAYLLLISAWARRVPILWAALPVIALSIVERLAFGTAYFANYVGGRLGGGPEAVSATARGMMPLDPMIKITPVGFLVSPGLWLGFLVAAAFLAGAVRLRRQRE